MADLAEIPVPDYQRALHDEINRLRADNVRLRSLLREVSAQRWECAAEDGLCPDCDATFSEPHDSECLLGQIDAELGE